MSKKYIKQVDSYNFVYPNNTIQEYDREIIHNINNNGINGSISNFSVVSATTDNIAINFDYEWDNTNNGDVFLTEANVINMLSIHLLTPNAQYLRPFVQVYTLTGNTTITGTSVTGNTTVNISSTGATGSSNNFSNGLFTFDFRLIGLKNFLSVCISETISTIAPPTPTPTPTQGLTPTPTPTPTVTPTQTSSPSISYGVFEIRPAYGINYGDLSSSGTIPTFTFPITGTTVQSQTMVATYPVGTTFTFHLYGTRVPSIIMNVSLIKNNVTIMDCKDINTDPTYTSFTLTTSETVNITDDLQISIGLGAC